MRRCPRKSTRIGNPAQTVRKGTPHPTRKAWHWSTIVLFVTIAYIVLAATCVCVIFFLSGRYGPTPYDETVDAVIFVVFWPAFICFIVDSFWVAILAGDWIGSLLVHIRPKMLTCVLVMSISIGTCIYVARSLQQSPALMLIVLVQVCFTLQTIARIDPFPTEEDSS